MLVTRARGREARFGNERAQDDQGREALSGNEWAQDDQGREALSGNERAQDDQGREALSGNERAQDEQGREALSGNERAQEDVLAVVLPFAWTFGGHPILHPALRRALVLSHLQRAHTRRDEPSSRVFETICRDKHG